MKKHATAMCLPFQHATGDHSKQLRLCLYVVQNYRFQLEIIIAEKWTVTEILFAYFFRREKINQLKVKFHEVFS